MTGFKRNNGTLPFFDVGRGAHPFPTPTMHFGDVPQRPGNATVNYWAKPSNPYNNYANTIPPADLWGRNSACTKLILDRLGAEDTPDACHTTVEQTMSMPCRPPASNTTSYPYQVWNVVFGLQIVRNDQGEPQFWETTLGRQQRRSSGNLQRTELETECP